jgi:predicted methyltransferase
MYRKLSFIVPVAVVLVLAGCQSEPPVEEVLDRQVDVEELAEQEAPVEQEEAVVDDSSVHLSAVLEAQPDEARARYRYRNPQATLEFFEIRPGMTVVEVLPGGGWYSRILLPYLGIEGHLIGVTYNHTIWPKFGMFDDETIESMRTWAEDWPEQIAGEAQDWPFQTEELATVSAFEFGSVPEDQQGMADAALLIRGLHNLARFESDGDYMTEALADLYAVLKPGGIVGVVQHQAREDMSDEFADGARGYLKKTFVKERFAEAGFEFVADSDINENPADQPGEDDFVWRLPPSLATSRDNEELREQMEALGESHRMTLKFRKPE